MKACIVLKSDLTAHYIDNEHLNVANLNGKFVTEKFPRFDHAEKRFLELCGFNSKSLRQEEQAVEIVNEMAIEIHLEWYVITTPHSILLMA